MLTIQEKKADQFAAELSNSGADVRPVYFSATELKSCKELITFTMKEYGQIDVLVNKCRRYKPQTGHKHRNFGYGLF